MVRERVECIRHEEKTRNRYLAISVQHCRLYTSGGVVLDRFLKSARRHRRLRDPRPFNYELLGRVGLDGSVFLLLNFFFYPYDFVRGCERTGNAV